MNDLPAEILRNIFGQLCITDADGLLESNEEGWDIAKAVARDREDVCTYLLRLVDDPVEFLRILLKTDSALCGRCVSPFLYPWVGERSSPWDLYCYGDPLQTSMLIKFLMRIGFSALSYTESKFGGLRQGFLSVIKGAVMITLHMGYGISPLVTMEMASISVDKCSITGYAVMSMEHALSVQEKFYVDARIDPEGNPVPPGLDVTTHYKPTHRRIGWGSMGSEGSYMSPHDRGLYGNSMEWAASVEMSKCVSEVEWEVYIEGRSRLGAYTNLSADHTSAMRLDRSANVPSVRAMSLSVMRECISTGIVPQSILEEYRTGPRASLVMSITSSAASHLTKLGGHLVGRFVSLYAFKYGSACTRISPIDVYSAELRQ